MNARTPTSPGRGLLSVHALATGASRLHRVLATSPLRLLTPDNHGRASWVYPSSFGGGFVNGDHVELTIDVGERAALFLGAQAQAKAYRGESSQRVRATVAGGGLFVTVPEPTACFAGATHAQTCEVDLAADASAVLVDGFSAGRAAYGEAWAFDAFAQTTTVRRDGRLLAHDSLRLGADAKTQVGAFHAFANVLLFGPIGARLAAHAPSAGEVSKDLVLARSALGDGVAVRLAASSTERLASAVRRVLVGLADELGDDPFARKP